ncbi:hypothetical protein ACFQY3_21460 [Paenibacillus farraposensis]|uniref:hypothetical protein n=1 Tax=Paenibacillus farraposensis TaxID=2807095 RepID=UPI003609A5F9
MASGTAVVGANEGGVKDNLIHRTTGQLCPAGDAAASQKLYRFCTRMPRCAAP